MIRSGCLYEMSSPGPGPRLTVSVSLSQPWVDLVTELVLHPREEERGLGVDKLMLDLCDDRVRCWSVSYSEQEVESRDSPDLAQHPS